MSSNSDDMALVSRSCQRTVVGPRAMVKLQTLEFPCQCHFVTLYRTIGPAPQGQIWKEMRRDREQGTIWVTRLLEGSDNRHRKDSPHTMMAVSKVSRPACCNMGMHFQGARLTKHSIDWRHKSLARGLQHADMLIKRLSYC